MIFDDYYGDIITFVKESQFHEDLKDFILEKFKEISLFDINDNKRIKRLFHNNTEIEIMERRSRGTTEDFEEFWEELQKKFKFGHESLSASDIEVATKIYKYFDEKTMTQQCLKFNSKSTPWTELQLISAALSRF